MQMLQYTTRESEVVLFDAVVEEIKIEPPEQCLWLGSRSKENNYTWMICKLWNKSWAIIWKGQLCVEGG